MIAEIRQLLSVRPFEPFSIVTSAGKQYYVASPEHASLHPKGTRVTVYFDDESQVSLSALHVTAIEQGKTTEV